MVSQLTAYIQLPPFYHAARVTRRIKSARSGVDRTLECQHRSRHQSPSDIYKPVNDSSFPISLKLSFHSLYLSPRVERPCFQVNYFFRYFFTMRCAFIITLLATSSSLLISASPIPAPVPAPNGGDAYTGAGGSATGGDATTWEDGTLGGIQSGNIDSDNGGDGGKATSGTAVGGSTNQWVHCLSCADSPRPGANAGNAYSGVGGNTDGGDA